MPTYVQTLAPYFVLGGATLVAVGAIRFIAKPWLVRLEPLVIALAVLGGWTVLADRSGGVPFSLYVSPVHAGGALAIAVAAFFAATSGEPGARWQAAGAWALGGWATVTLALWFLRLGDEALFWPLVPVALALVGALAWQLRRLAHDRAMVPTVMLLSLAGAAMSAIALQADLRAAFFAGFAVTVAVGAVGFVRAGAVSWMFAVIAGAVLIGPALHLAAVKPAVIPALLVLGLSLFAPQALTFNKPPGSGLEAIGRWLLKIVLSALPAGLATAVAFISLSTA